VQGLCRAELYMLYNILLLCPPPPHPLLEVNCCALLHPPPPPPTHRVRYTARKEVLTALRFCCGCTGARVLP
jgi:hypothetical protein